MDAETWAKTIVEISGQVDKLYDDGYTLDIFWMFIDSKYSDHKVGVRLEYHKEVK